MSENKKRQRRRYHRLYYQIHKKEQNRLNRKRIKERKEWIVNYLGGKCAQCGYSKCIAALDVHHINGRRREVSPSSMTSWSERRMLKEIKRDVQLLCANCHREVHHQSDENLKVS